MAMGDIIRLYIVIYFIQKKKLVVSDGGGLSGGDYCIFEPFFFSFVI